MNIKNVLTITVFAFAVGSAIAFSFTPPFMGFSRKVDVPGQEADCEPRATCAVGTVICTIFIDHDGNPTTPSISLALYDGTLEGHDDDPICGDILKRP